MVKRIRIVAVLTAALALNAPAIADPIGASPSGLNGIDQAIATINKQMGGPLVAAEDAVSSMQTNLHAVAEQTGSFQNLMDSILAGLPSFSAINALLVQAHQAVDSIMATSLVPGDPCFSGTNICFAEAVTVEAASSDLLMVSFASSAALAETVTAFAPATDGVAAQEAIPEPATLLLLGTAWAALLLRRRQSC